FFPRERTVPPPAPNGGRARENAMQSRGRARGARDRPGGGRVSHRRGHMKGLRSFFVAPVVGVLILVSGVMPSFASSHREAPLTAADPQIDSTDLYAFVSPDAPDTVTIISNWIPFENPAGGPNFYPWAPG